MVSLTVAALAALTDVLRGKIPNWLTTPALVGAVLAHGTLGAKLGGISGAASAAAWSVVGALLCALPLVPLVARGAIGGGDIKLFAALGALTHPMNGLAIEVHALVIAAVFALGQLAYRGVLFDTLGRTCVYVSNALRRKQASAPPSLLTCFRLGPSVFVGTLLTWMLGGA